MIKREMDAGLFVSRNETEATPFSSALELYAREVTSKKHSSASVPSRIHATQCHPVALRSLASIRGSDMATYRDIRPRRKPGPRHRALNAQVFTVTPAT